MVNFPVVPGSVVPVIAQFTESGVWEPFGLGLDRIDIAVPDDLLYDSRDPENPTDRLFLRFQSASQSAVASLRDNLMRIVGFPIFIMGMRNDAPGTTIPVTIVDVQGNLPWLISVSDLIISDVPGGFVFCVELVIRDGDLDPIITFGFDFGTVTSLYGVTNPGRTDTDGVVQATNISPNNTGIEVSDDVLERPIEMQVLERTITPRGEVPSADGSISIPGRDSIVGSIVDAGRLAEVPSLASFPDNGRFMVDGRIYRLGTARLITTTEWIVELVATD